MKPSDLIRDAGTGQMSHSKLWANVAYLTGTLAFAWTVYKGTATADIWLIYLGVVGASATASKWLSMRYSVNKPEGKSDVA
jgi:hypothetical protein